MKVIIKDKFLGIVIKHFENFPENATGQEKTKVLENVCKELHVNENDFVLETV